MTRDELLAMPHEELAGLCMKQELELEMHRADLGKFLEYVDSMSIFADLTIKKYLMVKGIKEEKPEKKEYEFPPQTVEAISGVSPV